MNNPLRHVLSNGSGASLPTLDPYLVIVVGALLAMGVMMVYSATFDWSYQSFGSETYIFMRHLRNLAIGGVMMLVMAFIDYRVWRRFAVLDPA